MFLAVALSSACALASGGDKAATSTYIHADYQLVHAGTSRMPRIEAALHGVLQRVRDDCPAAAAGSPQDPESTQLSNEVIGAMVTAVVALDRPAGRAFVSSTAHLSWSAGALTRTIGSYTRKVSALVAMPQPNLCGDVRAWAASGFKALPASTVAFSPRFMAVWVGLGELPAGLARYETAAARLLAIRTSRLESRFTDLEAKEVATWGEIMNALQLWP
jgi:hypothetical protein